MYICMYVYKYIHSYMLPRENQINFYYVNRKDHYEEDEHRDDDVDN